MNRNQHEQGPVASQLSGAQMAMDKCVQKLKHGIYDGGFSSAVAVDFEEVLYHLDLACQFLKPTEEAKINSSVEDRERLDKIVADFEIETNSLADVESASPVKQSILV